MGSPRAWSLGVAGLASARHPHADLPRHLRPRPLRRCDGLLRAPRRPARRVGAPVRQRPRLHVAATARRRREAPPRRRSRSCGLRCAPTRPSGDGPGRPPGPSGTARGGRAPRSGRAPCVRGCGLPTSRLQQEDLAVLDDGALVDHVRRACTNARDGHVLHFDLHGDDLGPLGLYLAGCQDWGIAPERGDRRVGGPLTEHRRSGRGAAEGGPRRSSKRAGRGTSPRPRASMGCGPSARSVSLPRSTTTWASSAGARSRGTTSTPAPSAS